MWGFRRKPNVTPEPDLELHPVNRLMFLAEQVQELSRQLLDTANEVRQELRHGKE